MELIEQDLNARAVKVIWNLRGYIHDDYPKSVVGEAVEYFHDFFYKDLPKLKRMKAERHEFYIAEYHDYLEFYEEIVEDIRRTFEDEAWRNSEK